MKNLGTTFIAGITVILLAAFFLWPLFVVVRGAFWDQGQWTLSFVLEVFRNPLYLEGLNTAFWVAVATTGVAIAVSLPLAALAARYEFPGKSLFGGLILAPLILPPFVGAIGIRQILGHYGALNALFVKWGLIDWSQATDWLAAGRLGAIVLTEALHFYPILYLNALAALSNIDPSMEEASENLGCTGWRRWKRITLPLMMPGLFAGGILVFIGAFTELGTPLMFDYHRIAPVQIFDGIKDIGANPSPYALVVVVFVASLLLFILSKFALGQFAPAGSGKSGYAALLPRLTGWRAGGAFLGFALVFGLSVLPHVGVVFTSFSRAWYQSVWPTDWTLSHYATALGHGLTLPSIANSLNYASWAMLFDVLLGVAIAWVITRSALRWRSLLDAVAMMPLAVPGMVIAFGYLAMTRPGQVFDWLDPTDNPTLLLIVAYAIRRLPYVTRAAVAGFQQTPIALEEAALNLGCPPVRTFCRITAPLIAANPIAGGLLAFSFSMLEVSDSLLLAQKQAYFPITKALFELFGLLGDGRFIAAALGVWAMTFLLMTLLLAHTLLGRRLGAVFRM